MAQKFPHGGDQDKVASDIAKWFYVWLLFVYNRLPPSGPRGRGEKVKEMGEWVQVLVQENLQIF